MNTSIALISPFVNPYEESSNRVNKLKKLLHKNNIDTYIITTNFDHVSKKKYAIAENDDKIIHIDVPAYTKNISLKRFLSHAVFSIKLLYLLFTSRKKFDALYCTVPTALSALVCLIYARYKQIRCAVDVIDLWPNSFVVLLPLKIFFKVLLFPWYLTSFLVYKFADKLFAASKEYARYVQKFNHTDVSYVNLGIDLDLINFNKQQSVLNIKKDSDKIYIAFGGSLGSSYDFDVIIDALIALKNKDITNYHFIFIGEGDSHNYIQKKIDKYQLSAEITGRLSYVDYIKYLSICDIGINSFKQNTKVVYSYKFNDYIGVGLVVLNNLHGETADIIIKYNLGLNFDYKENGLEKILENLLSNPRLIKEMKQNSEKYAQNIGNYEVEYLKILNYLKGLS